MRGVRNIHEEVWRDWGVTKVCGGGGGLGGPGGFDGIRGAGGIGGAL